MKRPLFNAIKRMLPVATRYWLGEKRVEMGRHTSWTDRLVDFSELRRLTPYRPAYGWLRGQCIDRYYIEQFIEAHRSAIRGTVLEIAEPMYARMFGGVDVDRIEVLDLDVANPKATIIADLTHAFAIADATFDAVICTQTLHCIYDFQAAFGELHRILKPGGVLLATFPGIAQLAPPSMMGAGHDFWRFTDHSIRKLTQSVFGEADADIQTFGNVYSSMGFLHGLVATELSSDELDYHDVAYQVLIGLSARKSSASAGI